jgi:hypothetical protein
VIWTAAHGHGIKLPEIDRTSFNAVWFSARVASP